MKPNLSNNPDECWQAVLARSAAADGQFVFAVQTTGIFCRPSCSAKHALRKNVRFFPDAQAALSAGFVPVSAVSRIKPIPGSTDWITSPAPASCWSRITPSRWRRWHSKWQ